MQKYILDIQAQTVNILFWHNSAIRDTYLNLLIRLQTFKEYCFNSIFIINISIRFVI